MSVSKIRALWLVDPGTARKLIIRAIEEKKGNIKEASTSLGCDYQTVRRIIKHDAWLTKRILSMKNMLSYNGHGQRGWGPWHKSMNKGD